MQAIQYRRRDGGREPAAVAGSALASWVDPNYQHVGFLDGNHHVRELYYPRR